MDMQNLKTAHPPPNGVGRVGDSSLEIWALTQSSLLQWRSLWGRDSGQEDNRMPILVFKKKRPRRPPGYQDVWF